ncbi:MAG: radical SAM protein [Candidatus Omnitrophica bacterium]|nr:radical SAM protein [Candidatus Omnitrophota bacterium]
MKVALVAFGNEESYGLLVAGGELLRHNQEIKFFDAEEDNVISQVCLWEPDFIFFSPMTTFFPKALQISREIKSNLPKAVSVFGGHHAISSPEISGIAGVDIVVVGPVKGSIEKILKKERGTIRTVLSTPDDLAMPARNEYYRDIPRMASRYRKIMLSMLGCPWNCSYCSSSSGNMSNIFGLAAHKRYYLSRRPFSAIIAEAKELLKHKTVEIEWVDDDIFSGADIESWIPEFVSIWEKEIGLPMYVSTTSYNALRMSDNALASLRRIVNCVGLGIQAIRPESLKLFNRSWDNEAKMKAAYARLSSQGYAVNLQCIVGLPVEDPVEDALETIQGLQRIGPGSICSCYPLMIYPGTAMEKLCAEKGFLKNAACNQDTNSGNPGLAFPAKTTKQLRNICKLATLFVKYNISEKWMRALIDIDLDDETSKALATVRYFECVNDRLKGKDKQEEAIFTEIMRSTKIRY